MVVKKLKFRWTFIIAGMCTPFFVCLANVLSAICGISGILVTYFFVPDMTGVDFVEEDGKFMEYLNENGWVGQVGDTDSEATASPGGKA